MTEETLGTDSNAVKCNATKRDGNPCQAHALRDSGQCFYHDPRYTEARAEGRARGRKLRQERAAERRMSALDWAARKLEENGEKLATLILAAAERGDWRAAAFLYERVHGKPRESLTLDVPSSAEALRDMSADQLEALRRQLEAETEPATPLLHRVPDAA